ncbi:unnamed protein product [Bursaphelenchus xylophilus]|uniref:(pine wood nematode) hypothetical protein n=1 Tax=Bursaphelenchus xylophilus TaxID=6326 RepID=A0A1I7RZP1_BURXY|nr:unnamed protein product [Bursaphelenchus xylophilus]CAG9111495.1 unnamed protein product [Bursaphelenchus xylophilus]
MLLNGRALLSLVNDKEYDRKICGNLDMLQDEHWRTLYAVMTANLLYLFESADDLNAAPMVLLIVEDCLVEMADDNVTGKPYSFLLRSKTTKRVFTFAAPDFSTLERWIHFLTVSSVDYIRATMQTMYAALSPKNSPQELQKPITDKKEDETQDTPSSTA